MESLALTLSSLMSKKGINSAELARKTGIGQPVIYRLMTGVTENPQILTLKPIADFFEISIDSLLGFTPKEEKQQLDAKLLHDCVGKLSTIKTISSVLADVLPSLILGYKKAVTENLIEESVPIDILPLLLLNINNLLKSAHQLQNLLVKNNNHFQDDI